MYTQHVIFMVLLPFTVPYEIRIVIFLFIHMKIELRERKWGRDLLKYEMKNIIQKIY